MPAMLMNKWIRGVGNAAAWIIFVILWVSCLFVGIMTGWLDVRP